MYGPWLSDIHAQLFNKVMDGPNSFLLINLFISKITLNKLNKIKTLHPPEHRSSHSWPWHHHGRHKSPPATILPTPRSPDKVPDVQRKSAPTPHQQQNVENVEQEEENLEEVVAGSAWDAGS